MLKIALFNQKAGVGTTTTTLNLAAAFQRKQRPVVMLDMDPQSRLTEVFRHTGIDPQQHLVRHYREGTPLADLLQPLRNGMQLLPAHAELMQLDTAFGRGPDTLLKLRQGLHGPALSHSRGVVLMDCCPVLGVIALSAVVASDVVLIPVSCDYLSINSAVKMDKALNALTPVLKRSVPRRYLLTRADKRKAMTAEVEQEMRRLFGTEVLLSKLYEHAALAESLRMGQHIFENEPDGAAAQDIMALYYELQDVVKQLPSAIATESGTMRSTAA